MTAKDPKKWICHEKLFDASTDHERLHLISFSIKRMEKVFFQMKTKFWATLWGIG